MANRIDREDLIEFKKEYPKAAVVAYINTYADIKAESDICCTSANAVQVVQSLPHEEIIFIPDRNLAAYVQTKVQKKIIPWSRGFCFLHTNLQPEKIREMRTLYPNALVLMHPETPLALHQYADEILGTGGMIKFVETSEVRQFLVATEEHMCESLKLRFPDKEFYPLMKHCTFMGQITLENTLAALQNKQYEVTIPDDIFEKAQASLTAMMRVIV